MDYSPELQAKLRKLRPRERKRVLAVGRRLAKAKLAKMLDQTSSFHDKAKPTSPSAPPK